MAEPSGLLRAWWMLRARARSEVAVERLWELWLREPSAPVGELLVSLGQPSRTPERNGPTRVALGERGPAVADALATAAARTGHPLGATARESILAQPDPAVVEAVCERALTEPELMAFCVGHGLAPAAPARQAVFFVVGGQDEQYRAVDPDGSLLESEHRAADRRVAAAVQRGLVELGDLDLLRRIAARGALTTADQARNLGERLAREGRWGDLWRFALDLPLDRSPALVRLIDPGWPDPNPELRAALAALTPEPLAHCLAAADVLELTMPRAVVSGSLSPDGRELVVVMRDALANEEFMRLLDVPSGVLLAERDLDGSWPGHVRHTGEAVLAGGWRGRFASPYRRELVRYDLTLRHETPTLPGSGTPLHDRLASSAMIVGDRVVTVNHNEPGLLRVLDGRGVRTARVELTGGAAHAVAASPSGERFAVDGPVLRVFDGHTLRPLAEATPDVDGEGLCFLGEDRIVVGPGPVVYRIDGGELVREGSFDLGEVSALVPVPPGPEFLVVGDPLGVDPVTYCDADTLEPVERRRDLHGRGHTLAWATPDGRRHAVVRQEGRGGGRSFAVHVVHSHGSRVRALARERPTDMLPTDLDTVRDVLDDPALTEARPLAHALEQLLLNRTRTEIHLSRAATLPADSDDIAL